MGKPTVHSKKSQYKVAPGRTANRKGVVAKGSKEHRMMMVQYRKMLKQEKKRAVGQKGEQKETSEQKKKQLEKKIKVSAIQKAQAEFQSLQEQKEKQKQEQAKARKDRTSAQEKYAQKKKDTHKKLVKRTKRGQLAMGGRMELLLNKIKKNAGVDE